MSKQLKEPATRRRVSPAILTSIGVHIVVSVILLRLIVIPNIDLFGHRAGSAPVERIGFIRLSQAKGLPTPGRDGGDGRVFSKTHAVKLVAPTSIPTSIPAVTSAKPGAAAEEGSGPLVGNGGPARGIKPVFSDPRLWGPPGKIVSAPRTLKQDLDSIIASAIGPVQDSIGAAAGQRDPTDWTIGNGNHKWGVDKKAIRLGPFSIPTALLAMLPLNVTGNPGVAAREKAFNYQHRDISEHAQQAINEADFYKAVKSIRERKDKERAAAMAGSGSDSTNK
ncbi:MAG: hypothetical protein M3Z17_01000 [Gemmatimonadota bacterium]|nr:hypothetical protein [Gemmatimonadota bacterium]